jgi:hypothetical protein
MLNILPRERAVKPLTIAASIDTFELWFPSLPRKVRTRIAAQLPRIQSKRSYRQGMKAGINRPTLAEIKIFGDYWNYNIAHCVTHRVHVAFDFTCSDSSSAAEFKRYLETHSIWKWSPNDALEFEDYYAVRNFAGRRRPARAPVIYLKGELTCRLELRFENAAACRRVGLEDPALIPELDPAGLFRRCVKLVEYRPAYIKKVIKHVATKYGEAWVGTALNRLDRHCALMMRRLSNPRHVYDDITNTLKLPRRLQFPSTKVLQSSFLIETSMKSTLPIQST